MVYCHFVLSQCLVLNNLSPAFTFSTPYFEFLLHVHANFQSLSFKLQYHIRQLRKSFDFISTSKSHYRRKKFSGRNVNIFTSKYTYSREISEVYFFMIINQASNQLLLTQLFCLKKTMFFFLFLKKAKQLYV